MRGAWLDEGKLTYREDLEEPAGEAVVTVMLAGICGTDLELLHGYAGFHGIPGHEFVGRVERSADRPDLVGRRVVGEINVACGDCATCHAGRPTHCERRSVVGIRRHPGCFAERLALPVANLHLVPDSVPDEVAVFAEPAAAALHVLDAVSPQAGERVLVVGTGRLGILVARALLTTPADVRVLARNQARLPRLASLGLPATLEAAPGSCDVVVDCSGTAEGLALARAAVRPAGTLLLKGTHVGAASLDATSLVVDEVRVIGSRCGRFAPALRALASGELQVDDLVEARYPLSDCGRAFEHAGRPGALKVLLES
jgi:threonine dehydrogenase-like Zn-dependent dehydrogenase